MRRQKFQRDFFRLSKRIFQRLKVKNRFVTAHRFAPLKHHFVINVKTLTPRHRAERYELLNAHGKRRIAAILIQAGKRREVIVSRG